MAYVGGVQLLVVLLGVELDLAFADEEEHPRETAALLDDPLLREVHPLVEPVRHSRHGFVGDVLQERDLRDDLPVDQLGDLLPQVARQLLQDLQLVLLHDLLLLRPPLQVVPDPRLQRRAYVLLLQVLRYRLDITSQLHHLHVTPLQDYQDAVRGVPEQPRCQDHQEYRIHLLFVVPRSDVPVPHRCHRCYAEVQRSYVLHLPSLILQLHLRKPTHTAFVLLSDHVPQTCT